MTEIDLTSFDGVAQESFIVFGRKNDEFPGTILLSSSTRTQSLDYAALIPFPSVSKKEDVRMSLVDVGDIDGDGTNDLLVGYPDAAQVVGYYQIAEDRCLHENLEASFSLHGLEGSGFGWAMDGLGDLNSDGYGDWMVSAKEEGVVYVIYGQPRDMLLGAIPVASNWTRELGFRIFRSTIETTSSFGLAVSRGGDVNKDGAMDVLVSALSTNAEGIIYVLFGKIIAAYSAEFIEDIYVDQLDGRNGVVIRAPRLSFGGISLAGVGDINSDGYADIAIGSLPYAGGFISQRTYLIFGNAIANLSASSETIYLSELSQRPGLGVLLVGGGFSVSAVGDVNQDGIVDLMVTNCLMSEGSQRYPTYFVLFPSNFSSSPTESPSSHPSRAPTALPSSSPSSSRPTNYPSLASQPGALPENSSLRPTVPFPLSLRPSRSKPSPRPSRLPTPAPSLLPSYFPSEGPTAAPTTRGTKSERTRPPHDNRVDPRTPSNKPTMIFNLSALGSLSRLPWTRIDCDRPGEYRASLGENTEFFVLSAGAITIVPSVSALNIIYFLPLRSQELSVVTIDQFQNTRDSINIRAFLDFQSVEDVPYSSHPLTFYLSSSQQVSLSNLQTIGDFNATASLLLYRPREEVRNNFLFQLSMLFGGLVLGVVLILFHKLFFADSGEHPKDKPFLTSTDEEVEEREFDEADDHDESLEDDDSLFLGAMFSSSADQSSHLSSLRDSCEWSSWNVSDEDSDDIIDPDDEEDADYLDLAADDEEKESF